MRSNLFLFFISFLSNGVEKPKNFVLGTRPMKVLAAPVRPLVSKT